MRLFFFLILTSIMAVSCKTNSHPKPEVTEVASPVPVNQEVSEDAAPPREKAQPDTFRVVVSMISIGEGTDPEGPAKLERVLKAWERKSGKTAYYTEQPWGREGEVDYNFLLRGWSRQEQDDFVKQLQSALKDEKLILVTENKVNRFKR